MLPAKGTNKLPVTAPSFFHKHVHLMLLPLCTSIWPPRPLVTAGWQAQDQARGPKGVGPSLAYTELDLRVPTHLT